MSGRRYLHYHHTMSSKDGRASHQPQSGVLVSSTMLRPSSEKAAAAVIDAENQRRVYEQRTPPKEAFVYSKSKKQYRRKSMPLPAVPRPDFDLLKLWVARCVFYLIATALLTLFLVDCFLQVRKLMERRITIARAVEPNPDLVLPAISFCPGFKLEELRGRWPLFFDQEDPDWSQYDDKFPRTRREAEEAWDQVTVQLEDILIHVSLQGEDGFNNYPPSDLLKKGAVPCVHFVEHSTFSGKCYSLVPTCKVTAKYNIGLKFNTSHFTTSKMDLYFHHPKASLGLNANFWPGSSVNVEELDPDVNIADFALTKMKHINNDGKIGFKEEDFYDCVNDLACRKMTELANANSSFCLFPSMKSLAGKEAGAFSPCTDVRNYYMSSFTSVFVLNAMHNPPKEECPKPEAWTSHSVSRRRDRNAGTRGTTNVYIFYDTTDMVVEEEYLLMDDLAFLAAVGGTMGILLGWSILDVARLVFKTLIKEKKEN